MTIHVVQEGDSHYKIAQKYNVPLQTLLQKIQSSIEFIKQNAAVAGTPDGIELMRNLPQQNLRMACMIIIILPVLAAYPFFQRYFVSGLTIGSVKE